MVEQIGAIIERGPEDWQIVQQDEDGNGRIELGGKWKFETPGQVEGAVGVGGYGGGRCRRVGLAGGADRG